MNRILVAFVPLVVVLIPGLRLIPAFFKWRIRIRILKHYRTLLALERSALNQASPRRQDELLARLEHIENSVNKMKVPASFADQFYALRGVHRFRAHQFLFLINLIFR